MGYARKPIEPATSSYQFFDKTIFLDVDFVQSFALKSACTPRKYQKCLSRHSASHYNLAIRHILERTVFRQHWFQLGA